MRYSVLSLVTGVCVLAIPVLFFVGIEIYDRAPITALLLLLVAIPSCLANAVVFDYVKRRPDFGVSDDRRISSVSGKTAKTGVVSDTKGTPWERDPGHTS